MWRKAKGTVGAPPTEAPVTLLVVDDEESVFETVREALSGLDTVLLCARDTAEARAILADDPRLDGALIDLILTGEPEDAALRLLEALRDRYPLSLRAALTKSIDPRRALDVAILDARFLPKLRLGTSLPWFARQALLRRVCRDIGLGDAVSQLARANNLTPKQTQIVGMVAVDVSRGEMCRRLGVTRGTLKNQAAEILRRTRGTIDAARLEDVGAHARRIALGSSRGPAATLLETLVGEEP
jgi:CheY-like chemotaxis protein